MLLISPAIAVPMLLDAKKMLLFAVPYTIPIADGERLTLTLWFSRDASHDEDAKLLSFLTQVQLNTSVNKCVPYLPSPASNNMYWFPPDQALNYESGFDLRCARLHVLGYDLYPSRDKSVLSAVDLSSSFLDLLSEPLQLARGDDLYGKEFANIMHALQVLSLIPSLILLDRDAKS
ncbi:hypothetical protein RJ640_010098 [Escallonia rubra]|uniref:Uncharacterized protein n=1 Tax=Escallonia rubra TaxID=112253 RepID=A0AA88UMH1_9ASTE|nr:hypothetical protein RJ640_010098 [Escallonia rubra]